MNIQSYILLLNFGLTLLIGLVTLRKPKFQGNVYLAVFSFIIAIWSFTYFLYDLQFLGFPRLFLISTSYFFSTIAASALFAFSLRYSNHSDLITRVTIVLFAIYPVLTQILFWVEPWREALFLDNSMSVGFISHRTGLWADINTLYLHTIETASLILIVGVFLKKTRTFLFRSGTILVGSFAPFIFRFFDVARPVGTDVIDYSLIGYAIAVFGMVYGFNQNSQIEVKPITYDAVVKGMSDGWMVLDLNNNIIEMNPAVEGIIGVSRQILYGKSVKSILPDWPEISSATEDGKELEMRRSIKSLDTWKYLNVRLSILKNESGEPFGQLIIWRDITERKLAENARQRARDEMFVLLNSISNVASHTTNLIDFLSESIYQIIYPFQTQIVVVFLIDEDDKYPQNRLLHLVSHFGLSAKAAKKLNSIFVQDSIFDQIFKSKQSQAFTEFLNSPNVPGVFKEMEISNVVIAPLVAPAGEDSKVLGALCLGRNEPSAYTTDEVVRLTTIADQIANLIDNDRRRQLAIAVSERERLLRDLHDSVSQKLYGLLTLTEAAQAGLEAGSKVVPSQVLKRIGENARQAVKEMRLFLYEMQPVELEKEGLVTVLHHRLAAVEGRADVQARFLADEAVSMSKDKEIALYYIAQEALNNVLKHAHAHSVSVTLKQNRRNIVLEIDDDGQGFNPKSVEKGGMGLQNMRIRASQVNGKLRIVSKPRGGTMIKVTVGRERLPGRIPSRKKQ